MAINRKSRPLWAAAALSLAVSGQALVANAADKPVDFSYRTPSRAQSALFVAFDPKNPKGFMTLEPKRPYKIPAGWVLSGRINMQPQWTMSGTGNAEIDGAITRSVVGDGAKAYEVLDIDKYEPKGDYSIFLSSWQMHQFNRVSFNLNGGTWTDPRKSDLDSNDSNLYSMFIAPFRTVYKPSAPVREGYTFVGWVGTSKLDPEANKANKPKKFDRGTPYPFTEVDPDINVGYIRGEIVKLSAEWAKPPTLTVEDKAIRQGQNFDPASMVKTAADDRGKPLNNKVKVEGTYDVNTPGEYELTFTVTDKYGGKTVEKAKLVVKHPAPTLEVKNKTLAFGENFDPASLVVSSTGANQDGVVPNAEDVAKVNVNKPGEYRVRYTVTNPDGEKVEKTTTLTVKLKPAEEEKPNPAEEEKPASAAT